MTFVHGITSYVNINSIDWSAYVDNFQLTRNADTAEVSSINDADRAFVVGLKGATGSMGGPWDPTLDGYLAADLGVSRTFEYGPEGNDNGDVKYSGNMIITQYTPGGGTGAAETWNANFTVTGTITVGTYP